MAELFSLTVTTNYEDDSHETHTKNLTREQIGFAITRLLEDGQSTSWVFTVARE